MFYYLIIIVMETIKVVSWFDDDWRCRLLIKWMWKKLNFLDWESEDANLWRDFNDCYSISSMIKEANKLWLEWKEIQIENIEDNDLFSDNYN